MNLDELQALCDEVPMALRRVSDRYINAARTALPELIARVRAAEAQMERVREACDKEGFDAGGERLVPVWYISKALNGDSND